HAEIPSANRPETPPDASAGSCQAERRATKRAALARARSSISVTRGRSHEPVDGVMPISGHEEGWSGRLESPLPRSSSGTVLWRRRRQPQLFFYLPKKALPAGRFLRATLRCPYSIRRAVWLGH